MSGEKPSETIGHARTTVLPQRGPSELAMAVLQEFYGIRAAVEVRAAASDPDAPLLARLAELERQETLASGAPGQSADLSESRNHCANVAAIRRVIGLLCAKEIK